MAAKHVRFDRSEGKAYKPRVQSSGKELPFGTDARNASERFVIVHNPESWDFVDGKGFLPVLRQVRLKPGAGGVGKDRNPSRLMQTLRDLGNIIIPDNSPALGKWADYNTGWPVEGGGTVYEFVGAVPTGRPNGAIRWEPAPDWNDFREHVVKAGFVPPPFDFVMEAVIEKQEERISQMRRRTGVAPERIKAEEDRLSAMREVYNAYLNEDEEPPAGETKGKGKTK